MPASHPSVRDLLIALNASDSITRGALCRLALQVDEWQDAPPGKDLTTLAHRLGVPLCQLRRALGLSHQVPLLAASETAKAAAWGGAIVTLHDAAYPLQLRELALPPPVLYLRGELPSGPAIAIVGARRMDAYGREVASYFAQALAGRAVTVISGFARGVDTVAHRAALDAGGKTVAVLGCGIDVPYPEGQEALAEEIVRHGAILSEFPLGSPPRAWHFPQRNRVIAALGKSTLVVQAALRSGSLITAHHALELGRDVFAVPGPIFAELAQGTNALLAEGAQLACCADDVLEQLGAVAGGFNSPSVPTPAAVPPPTGLAGKVLAVLPLHSKLTVEDITALVQAPIEQVLSALLELELAGWLRREPGPLYCR